MSDEKREFPDSVFLVFHLKDRFMIGLYDSLADFPLAKMPSVKGEFGVIRFDKGKELTQEEIDKLLE